MASNYGLGVVAKLNPGLNDLLDVEVPKDVKKGRNNNRDFVLRYKNDSKEFALTPAATQAHDHKIDLAELEDVHQAGIAAIKTTGDATPFGFTWNPDTAAFMPYSIPRNIDELLEGMVVADTAGVPFVLVYNETERKYEMRDIRNFVRPTPPSPLIKLIAMPLHFKVSPLTTILKAGGGLVRWINSGEWYCSYRWQEDSGPITLFKDAPFNVLGLRGAEEPAILSLEGCRPAPTLDSGTLIIRMIKSNSEDEYDPLIGGFSIKCKKRVKCAIIISLDSNNIGEGANLSFVGDDVEELDSVRDNTEATLDISTITLKRAIIQDIRYFRDTLSSDEITALLSI